MRLDIGIAGVGTVKNLREEGFDAIGFERSDWVGGLWQWSTDTSQTTVLQSTRTNISKQRSCYQDYPFPENVPNYPSGEDVAKYIQSYADHFGVSEHFRLGASIERVERSGDEKQWLIRFNDKKSGPRTELFDKVVVTTGAYCQAFTPKYPGIGETKIRVLHSQNFKEPNDFAGKRVVVVGFSNTAADAATDLSKVTTQTYISHRTGARIITRTMNKGKPMDWKASRRITSLSQKVNARFPNLAAKMGSWFLERMMKKQWPFIQPAWNLSPAPPIANKSPLINDEIISCLRAGTVKSARDIRRFIPDSKSLEFTDGVTLTDIDGVIFCTGYYFDWSIFASEADPTAFAATEWDASPHQNGLRFPRLYQGLLSSRFPESLAFIGPVRGFSGSAFANYDLWSQAVAQIWKGNYPLPSRAEMNAWCDRNYKSNLAQLQDWHLQKVGLIPQELEHWLNDAAGNGVNEILGSSWSWAAWKFWWNNRALYKLIMTGIDTPFPYRLFEGRRKKWDGAAEAIYKVNGKKYVK
ncbi:FAD/NAD(P)-binding domain-containing protein [Viridothelium virens]|uniref:FAD/NAD(P)-binding domain-containing protein n=1 Tax=Viridothelium virens TaxID=1048519 RepID=A0A6A6H7M3_VIRVR|nr:FAD/NAD(P)-binding domain-containing protein [Viridothelium virens]